MHILSVFYMEDCGVSKGSCSWIGWMHVESFVVCIVGKMAQDGVKVSFPSSLVGFLWVSSLHALVFVQKIFWWPFLFLFFVLSFRNCTREERWEGSQRERCMVYIEVFVHIELRIILNSNGPSEIVNINITLVSFGLINPLLTSCGLPLDSPKNFP